MNFIGSLVPSDNGPFTYVTHNAVHYHSYTVHQISLYGSVQSQLSIYNLLATSAATNASSYMLAS